MNASPAAPTASSNAIRIGYARVSTRAQDHAAQLQLLNAADCREIVEETISTRRKDRPKLQATVAALKAGDTLVVTKPDRVARSMKELLVFLEDELAPRGINLEFLTGICAGLHRPNGQTIADKLLFMVAAMAAEMERNLISERTNEGLDAARAAGRVGGRPTAVTDDVLAAARARRARGQSVTQIARELGVGRSTLYRALEDDELGQGTPARDSDNVSPDAGNDPHSDAIVVAMAEAFGRNTAMGEAFLADQTPAMREQYRNEVADAQERIRRRRPARKPADAVRPRTSEADDQPHDHNAMTADGGGEQGVSAVSEQAQTEVPAAPVPDLYVARLYGEDFLLLADRTPVGWVHAAPDDSWQVHGRDGQLVTTLQADGVLNVAARAVAALGISHIGHTAVTVGPLTDDRGRAVDTSPTALASWSLLKGRVPGRTDVIVRGRCIGWLQRDDRGRDVACTLDGPVPGSASTNRVQAVTALLAALVAPAPLPELGPEARTARRPRARFPRERPICPFTPAQLAAAAFAENLPRLADGSYRVHIHDGVDDTELGRVYRSGRRWQALAPDGRVAVHRAATRTEAVDRLLATPGPLFGDPADTVLHEL